jgi:hypothetical protein
MILIQLAHKHANAMPVISFPSFTKKVKNKISIKQLQLKIKIKVVMEGSGCVQCATSLAKDCGLQHRFPEEREHEHQLLP